MFEALMPETSTPVNLEPDTGLGIIGFGKMGVLHSGILNLLNPGCVKFIVERNRMLCFGASRLLRDLNFYRDIDDMLRRENPEIVYVTTPTPSHCSIVLRLLEAGVDTIFVEKPPTVNGQELETLIKAKNPEQAVMVGLQKRFSLPVRHAKQLLNEGAIGELERVSATINSSDVNAPSQRYSSIKRGVLLDLGVHLVDLIQWFCDDLSVQEADYSSVYTEVDDTFNADLSSGKDLKISLEASWSDPSYRRPETHLRFQGTQGGIDLSEDSLTLTSLNGEDIQYFQPHYYRDSPPVNLADPEYTLEDMHLLKVAEGSLQPLTSLENVRGTMNLIDEMYQKAAANHHG